MYSEFQIISLLVNHFGKFVRYFFSLPPPTDQIPARMVLTTIDSAIYTATQEPKGPVHINCPFREPLEDYMGKWTLNCLRGLDFWMSDAEPFTKYIRMQHFYACNDLNAQHPKVVQVIQSAKQGLLLIGAIHTEDEIRAALLLSIHLFWPVIADILSSLRLRKVLTSFPEVESRILFIDHLDHALLSDSVRSWVQPDVVIQIGSRITSKRVSQLLEASMCSYILIDKHPFRHDPSHIVTYRIQCTITEFAETLLKIHFPRRTRKWSSFLQVLNKMVALEISFQIKSECFLTEPYVAHAIVEALQDDSALFIGNSMVIRDVDMYGKGWVESTSDYLHTIDNAELPYQAIRVAGNRGASGIDGLLSTAIGFAVGCNKRVLCVVGDISFLHDTNGLALLNQRTRRKPMTILVINNHGGAIFSLLPIADRTDPSILTKYFYTSHNISLNKLCEAHSLKHLRVQTKMELQHALSNPQRSHFDYIIEVESCITDNSAFHRILGRFARQTADQALSILSHIPGHIQNSLPLCRILKMEYSLYRIQLSAPLTSTCIRNEGNKYYREGFVLSLTLDDGSTGYGEVAPIEIHQEDLLDAEEQLRFLHQIIEGSELSYFLPLFKGSFSSWIWRDLGIMPSSIFPSVRCGLEMAILNALAARQGCSFSDIILGCGNLSIDNQSESVRTDVTNIETAERIKICALVDCSGTPMEVSHLVSQLVDEGFTTIKIKVARRENPLEDAAVIQEIRKKVGYHIYLRADANQNWSFKEAVQFGSCVKHYDLQYIEEPVQSDDDIIKFCEETGLPVALDETIDKFEGDPLDKLKEFVHPGIAAVVIKPSVVGGFENAALIARWALLHEKMVVISGTFESSLSLSAYIQFAFYIECQKAAIFRVKEREMSPTIAHGLGTYRWLIEDITTKQLKICVHPDSHSVEASVKDAALLLHNFQINLSTIKRNYRGEQVESHQQTVEGMDFSCSIRFQEVGSHIDNRIVIFLHGFLGTSDDWVPIMKSISASARCISVDLPGHGRSKIQWKKHSETSQDQSFSVELVAVILHHLLCDITNGRVVLVGYSMGARIALYMALKFKRKIEGAILLSGSPGLKDDTARRTRTAHDDARAHYLSGHGLQNFLEIWYRGNLWNSLRDHPHFERITNSRAKHDDIQSLAKALSGLSVGRQLSLWEDLKQCKVPLLLLVGEKDKKFKEIAQQMRNSSMFEGGYSEGVKQQLCKIVEVPNCGHAVHLENPLAVINSLRKFMVNL